MTNKVETIKANADNSFGLTGGGKGREEKQYYRMLDQVRAEELPEVGGKGANLGEMIAAGLPVPGGFVLLTGSYRDFVSFNGLDEKIERILGSAANGESQELEQASLEIQDLFEKGTMPAPIIEAIDRAYSLIGAAEVAVRSSATAEDLPGTSFAGQYSTYLNVRGSEELYRFIKKCWASLWNYRALSYRVRQGIGNTNLAHGVVVQAMINAEKSGILFTANPVNGRRDQMLLNASWGLGEAIVGGEVTPDQWIIDKNSSSLVEERPARKEIMTVRKEGGIEFVAVPEELQEVWSLNRDEVIELLELGHKVETYFGSPQDIEWAYLDGIFYLVQTRPITSLFPLPEKVEGWGGLRIHTNMNLLSQGMQEPFTPMGGHIFMKSVVAIVKNFNSSIRDEDDIWWLQSVGGRMFTDYTELLRKEKWWEAMIYNDYFSDQDPLSAKALMQWLDRNREEVTAKKSPVVKTMLKGIIPLLKVIGPMTAAMTYGTLFPLRARAKALRKWQDAVRESREGALNLQGNAEKLDYIDQQIDDFNMLSWTSLSLISPSFRNVEKAEKIAAPYLKDCSDFRLVEKSLPYNGTTEMGIDLMKIARALDQRGLEPALEQPEIIEFFKKYGHRSNTEVDIGVPRWHEEPEYILGLIRSYIENGSYRQGLDNFYRGAEEAEAAIARIKANLEQAGKKKLAARVERLLRNYREIFGLREESKYSLTHIYDMARKLFIEIGKDLAGQGRLEQALDIFFLRSKDIRAGGDLKEMVKANRAAHKRYMNLKAPRLLSSTGESIFSAASDDEGALCGTPVSPGVYEGRARILHSPEEGSKIVKGDILVTAGTNPAWTPMFLNLGAIVVETGGPISHGAVVAREYGVPAVVGVGEATSLIRDGQMIRVNGETGQVELLD